MVASGNSSMLHSLHATTRGCVLAIVAGVSLATSGASASMKYLRNKRSQQCTRSQPLTYPNYRVVRKKTDTFCFTLSCERVPPLLSFEYHMMQKLMEIYSVLILSICVPYYSCYDIYSRWPLIGHRLAVPSVGGSLPLFGT